MTTTVTIEEAQIKLKGLLALAREGDEIVIEENGEQVGKIISVKDVVDASPRKFGRGKPDGYFISPDFDDELPESFWGFDREK